MVALVTIACPLSFHSDNLHEGEIITYERYLSSLFHCQDLLCSALHANRNRMDRGKKETNKQINKQKKGGGWSRGPILTPIS